MCVNREATHLQFLHFSPNNIPFPHTVHVWDIQYFVENLQTQKKTVRFTVNSLEHLELWITRRTVPELDFFRTFLCSEGQPLPPKASCSLQKRSERIAVAWKRNCSRNVYLPNLLHLFVFFKAASFPALIACGDLSRQVRSRTLHKRTKVRVELLPGKSAQMNPLSAPPIPCTCWQKPLEQPSADPLTPQKQVTW